MRSLACARDDEGTGIARFLIDPRPLITLSSRAAQTTPVLPGPTDPTMLPHANELCEVLRYAQDDGYELQELMRGGTLVDGAVLRHLVIFHQAEAPIDQGPFVFVGRGNLLEEFGDAFL